MLSSAEVGTLITALGCGIGREEFNVAKLRYHHIIIMTDADVDGSHIRTLLLTFFYRQMPELIERGYIYIGLPPLYKLKQGKHELYLKDDAALNSYLISNAVDNAELLTATDLPPISGTGLERLLMLQVAADETVTRLSHRFDPNILRAMLSCQAMSRNDFADPRRCEAWLNSMNARLSANSLGKPKYSLSLHNADNETAAHIRVERLQHGLVASSVLALATFDSTDFKPLMEAAAELHDLLGEGAKIQRGGRAQSVSAFAEVHAWLFEEAKRGRTVQRFKGLGEMNPEQLWETTVNPDTRRLLRVRIEDAVAADQIFSTLMGDVVEPRRDFIEENALRVSNLDI